MKTKQYFKRYQDAKNKLMMIALTFVDIAAEANEKVQTPGETGFDIIRKIYDDANEKANEFINLVNESDNFELQQNAFKVFVKNTYPELYNLLKWN